MFAGDLAPQDVSKNQEGRRTDKFEDLLVVVALVGMSRRSHHRRKTGSVVARFTPCEEVVTLFAVGTWDVENDPDK